MSILLAAVIPLGWTGAGHLILKGLRVRPGIGPGGGVAVRFLIGSGAISTLVFAGLLLAPRYALAVGWCLCAVLAVGAAADGALQLRRLAPGFPVLPPHSRLQLGLLAALAAETVLLARAVWLYGADNDAVAIWALKGRVLATNGMPASLLQDPSRVWSHPEYPLHVPIDIAMVFQVVGAGSLQPLKLLFVAFAVALVLLFQGLAARLGGTTSSALYGLLLLGVPFVVASALPIAADIPLGALLLGAAGFLWLWADRHERGDLVLASALFAISLWTKRDAEAMWVAGAAIVAVAGLRSARRFATDVLTYILPALPALGWYVVAGRIAQPDPDFAPISLSWLLGHLDRLPIAIQSAAPYLLNGYFDLVWALLALAVIRPGTWTRGMLAALFLTVLQLGAISGAYVFSEWPQLAVHVAVSFPRIVAQVTPLALLLTLSRFGAEDLREGLRSLGSYRRWVPSGAR